MTATESDAEAEAVFNGVFDDVLGVNTDVGLGGTGVFGRNAASNYGSVDLAGRIDYTSLLPPCLNITIASTNSTFPVTITLDFGAGCSCSSDGHFRQGKIITTYTDRLLHPGAIATTKFEEFYIDSIRIDNSTTLTITNTGTPDRLQLTVDVSAKLSKPNGNYSEWHSHKVITRIEGNLTTSNPLDDVFKIEGYASGKVKRNDLVVAWKAEITDPLIKSFSCHWISKGTVKIARENLSSNSQWTGTLNYGTGICDKYATLTLNNIPHQITLR